MWNRKRIRFFVGAALIASLAGGAAWLYRVRTRSNVPVVQFVEQTFDAGTVRGVGMANVRHAFSFKNSGGAELVLGEIKTTCGCTVATLPKTRMAPGEQSAVEVVLSLTSAGEVAKSILVYSNAPGSPHQLTIAANYHPTKYFQVTPEVLSMGVIEEDQSGQQDFEVNVFADTRIESKLSEIVSETQKVKHSIVGSKFYGIANTAGYYRTAITVAVTPPGNGEKFEDSLTLKFQDPELKPFVVPVRGERAQRWRISPRKPVLVFAADAAMPGPTRVSISSPRVGQFQITKIDNPFSAWLAAEEKEQDGKPVLFLTPVARPPTGTHEQAVVVTLRSTSGSEVVRIPVLAKSIGTRN
jgi:hypothetical protein